MHRAPPFEGAIGARRDCFGNDALGANARAEVPVAATIFGGCRGVGLRL
jgi:hypothetical protein